jgi:hypothetical protein
MQKYTIGLLFILPVILHLTNCSGVDENLCEDEKIIYTMIIDSVFNDSYKIININDSTHSLVRYISQNVFSETLFGEKPETYFKSLFEKKKCTVNKSLIGAFIENNRNKYYIPKNYKPGRDHKYVNYLSIYYYLHARDNYKNKLAREIRDDVKFGLISLSRAGFNSDHTEALLEVNIHRKQRMEIFYSYFKKINGRWKLASNCYLYGPYRIKD